MAEVTFIYKTLPTIIQCKKNDLFKDIIQNFAIKAELKLQDIYFIYDAKIIDINLTFEKIAKAVDKKLGKINVLVVGKNEEINQETKEIQKILFIQHVKKIVLLK